MKVCTVCYKNNIIDNITFTRKRSLIKYLGGSVCTNCAEDIEIPKILNNVNLSSISHQLSYGIPNGSID